MEVPELMYPFRLLKGKDSPAVAPVGTEAGDILEGKIGTG